MKEDLNAKLEKILIEYNEVVGADDVGEDNIGEDINLLIEKLETFYGVKEDQNTLLRELRALRIKKNEKVKRFQSTLQILIS